MKPLLIGQAPGPNTSHLYPLYPIPRTSAGGRLQELTGLSRQEYLDRFDRMNLLTFFPGKDKRDDKFPMAKARLAADSIRQLLIGREVILVGRNVATAFGYPADAVGWHQWTSGVEFFDFAVIPHPSGRSRWYNNAENAAESKLFWDRYLRPVHAQEDKKVVAFPASQGHVRVQA